MWPVMLELGNFELYSYGVMIAIAFIVAIIWAAKNGPREGVKADYIFEILIIVVILAAFGSRLVFVARNIEFYRDEFMWGMFGFRDGGLVFHGGFIFAALGVLAYSYYRKLSFFKLMDMGAIMVAMGYPITRIGCFLNGCCYGAPTDLPWGVVYPAVDNISRHPAQLYSSILMVGVLIILLYVKKFKFFEGYLLSWFLILYGIYRFVVEFVRINPEVFGGLTEPQLVSIGFIILGSVVLIIQRKRLKSVK